MKTGVQRDLLAAFWLLFDEFEIGNDCDPPVKRVAAPDGMETSTPATDAARPHAARPHFAPPRHRS